MMFRLVPMPFFAHPETRICSNSTTSLEAAMFANGRSHILLMRGQTEKGRRSPAVQGEIKYDGSEASNGHPKGVSQSHP
jgi:hypothetical protein